MVSIFASSVVDGGFLQHDVTAARQKLNATFNNISV
jgi:hypothetical protein